MKKLKYLYALMGVFAIGLFAYKAFNNEILPPTQIVQAQHVKGDLGKFTVPKRMRGTWYGKYFDIGGIKSKTLNKLKVSAHKIGGTVLHKQTANFNGTKIPKKAQNWARVYYPVTYKKDHGIKYVGVYPWVSPASSGTHLGLYHYKGHKVLIERTTSSSRITNVYWKSKRLAKRFGGYKPKELKRYAEY